MMMLSSQGYRMRTGQEAYQFWRVGRVRIAFVGFPFTY